MNTLTIKRDGDNVYISAICECGGATYGHVCIDAGEPAGFDGSRAVAPHLYIAKMERDCSPTCLATDEQIAGCLLSLAEGEDVNV